VGEAHELLENRRSYVLHGKVAIDVAGTTVALPARIEDASHGKGVTT
jgi:hypothetical protein